MNNQDDFVTPLTKVTQSQVRSAWSDTGAWIIVGIIGGVLVSLDWGIVGISLTAIAGGFLGLVISAVLRPWRARRHR